MVDRTEAWRTSWSGLALRSVRATEDDNVGEHDCLDRLKLPCHARRELADVPETDAFSLQNS
jgi:hypothetical protein